MKIHREIRELLLIMMIYFSAVVIGLMAGYIIGKYADPFTFKWDVTSIPIEMDAAADEWISGYRKCLTCPYENKPNWYFTDNEASHSTHYTNKGSRMICLADENCSNCVAMNDEIDGDWPPHSFNVYWCYKHAYFEEGE
jgi:hypothetical protein